MIERHRHTRNALSRDLKIDCFGIEGICGLAGHRHLVFTNVRRCYCAGSISGSIHSLVAINKIRAVLRLSGHGRLDFAAEDNIVLYDLQRFRIFGLILYLNSLSSTIFRLNRCHKCVTLSSRAIANFHFRCAGLALVIGAVHCASNICISRSKRIGRILGLVGQLEVVLVKNRNGVGLGIHTAHGLRNHDTVIAVQLDGRDNGIREVEGNGDFLRQIAIFRSNLDFDAILTFIAEVLERILADFYVVRAAASLNHNALGADPLQIITINAGSHLSSILILER